MKQAKKFGLYNMVHCRLKQKTKRLYLDFNCLIHRACRECKPDSSEEEMISHVIEVLAEIVRHVNPSELVYIAIDGSVPMGKCKQQRFRRFKSVKENIEINAIKKMSDPKHTHNENSSHLFDYNSISPGTNFMNKLADAILKKIEEWSLIGLGGSTRHCSLIDQSLTVGRGATTPNSSRCIGDTTPNFSNSIGDTPPNSSGGGKGGGRPPLFVLSDSHEPGEGEHKIMNHFRKNRPDPNDGIVIYGLDADLVFLTLSIHHSSAYLFRENTFRDLIEGETPDYLYLNIDDLRKNIIQLIVQAEDTVNLPTTIGKFRLTEITTYNTERLIEDYIFINFFLGNDFVNRLYCLSIRDKGCETILQIYRFCIRRHRGKYLVEKSSSEININMHFLQDFLEYLAEYEEYWWTDPPKYHQPSVRVKSKTNGEELSKIEREIEQFGIVERYLSDIGIKLGESNFKSKYYGRLFELSDNNTLEQNIKQICLKYWSTVRWTLEYYLKECPDWDWYYPHEYAPLMDDLIHYSKNINDRPFNENSHPNDVYHQLMIILPPKSFNLLPKKYQWILRDPKYSCYFPKHFDYRYYGHRFTWECPPKIPILGSQVEGLYLANCNS